MELRSLRCVHQYSDNFVTKFRLGNKQNVKLKIDANESKLFIVLGWSLVIGTITKLYKIPSF